VNRRTQHRRWTGVALAVVAVAAVSAVVSGPAAAGGSPSEEAPAFARERGITVAEAEQRLSWQSVAPDLAEQLDPALGQRFGGVWIDVRDGDRVKIGVVGGPDTDTLAVIRRTATAVGLTEGYEAVKVARPSSALSADLDRVSTQLDQVNADAPVGLGAGLRTDLNALQLDVPATGLTDAQRALATTLQQQLGGELVVVNTRGGYAPFACAFPYCDPPLRGGIRIDYPTTWCSAAFTAKSNVDSREYLITAGHCAYQHYDNWSTNFSNGVSHVVGPVWHWEWNSGGDAAILSINNVPGWTPQGRVQVTAGPETTANDTYNIADTKWSVVGQRICTTGAATGTSRCGQVTELDFTADYGGVTVHHLGRSSICGHPGDSGAPTYAKHHAYGIVVAGASNGDCDTLYQGIRGAEALLNVTILTASS
jgi:Trypsin